MPRSINSCLNSDHLDFCLCLSSIALRYLSISTQKCGVQTLEEFQTISRSLLGTSTQNRCIKHGGISDHLENTPKYNNSKMWYTNLGIISNHLDITSTYINSEMWCTKCWKNFRPFGNHILLWYHLKNLMHTFFFLWFF